MPSHLPILRNSTRFTYYSRSQVAPYCNLLFFNVVPKICYILHKLRTILYNEKQTWFVTDLPTNMYKTAICSKNFCHEYWYFLINDTFSQTTSIPFSVILDTLFILKIGLWFYLISFLISVVVLLDGNRSPVDVQIKYALKNTSLVNFLVNLLLLNGLENQWFINKDKTNHYSHSRNHINW